MRRKIPQNLERKVLVKNKHCCCICEMTAVHKPVQIHHIDGNNSNNKINNLSVLCLDHHSMADAGLKRGKLGSGKKITPSAVKDYKKCWETKVELTSKLQKRTFPLYQKKHMMILYQFEINKIKNKILSISDSSKRLQEQFDYLDQLVLEELISGIHLRKFLIQAYSDIALQTIGDTNRPKMLSSSLLNLFLHLVGPEYVSIRPEDKTLIEGSLQTFKILGSFAGEFSDKISTLKNVCNSIIELAEIVVLYNLKDFKNKILRVLKVIQKDCSEYESEKRSKLVTQQRLKRVNLIKGTIQKIKLLK